MLSLLSIILAIFISEAEIDIAIPSFPEIQSLFQISVFQTELILTLNLMSHCITAIFVGYLGDKYGKKNVIIFGLFVFLIGTIIILNSTNFNTILFGRILQGSGVAAPMVLGLLLAIENLNKNLQEQRISLLNGIANISLAFTPSIGSYVSLYFGWRGNFYLLLFLSIFNIIFIYLFVTKDSVFKDEKNGSILIEYLNVLKNKKTMKYILVTSLFPAAWFVFIGLAPIIYINNYKVSLNNFGIYQGIIALLYGIVSLLSKYILDLLGKRKSIYISFFIIKISIIINIIGYIFNLFDPLFITIVMIFASIGVVIPINLSHLIAISSIKNLSGTINSIIVIIRWTIASIGIQTASIFYSNNFNSTFYVITSLFIIGIFFFITLFKRNAEFKNRMFE